MSPAMSANAATRDRGLIVGADIGGTKTAILVCDADGEVLARHIAPTAVGAPDQAADAIASLVQAALHEASATTDVVAALGIGVPGRVDRERGQISLAVNLNWHDLPLGPRLEARLGIPTFIDNDVRAAALGLHRRRLFGPTESLVFLAIGTGIAAGVVLDGKLHHGAHGLAGEIGHVVVQPDGPPCACGNRGCLETIAAGPALARATLAGWAATRNGHGAAATTGHTAPDDGTPATDAEGVFAAAARGDETATGVIANAGRAIAWGIHLLALSYDVERIVLGGGVSHAGEPFMAPIRAELDRLRAASPLAAEILSPDLVQLLPAGSDAGAWGAVIVAREALAGAGAVVAAGREVGHA
ncbi:MAG TPA: ROK family protein [Candidatus Limnocylindrales bacterium]|nr:ROK family protein [Candidatus Limnocylindrales bacterium]